MSDQKKMISRPLFAPPRKILLIGDSLTQWGSHAESGWGIELQRRYARRADVLNRGLSGWTSRWARAYLDAVLDEVKGEEEVLFATLWFGANDAQLKEGPKGGRYHVDISEYKNNLLEMMEKLLGKTDILFVFTPPPVYEENREKWAREQFGEYVRDLDPETSRKYGIACLEAVTEMEEKLKQAGTVLYRI